LKAQPFFRSVDWDKLLKKRYEHIPLKTTLKQENFDREYVQMTPRLSLNSDENPNA